MSGRSAATSLQHPKDSTFHAGKEICSECCSPRRAEKYALQEIKRRESESTSFIKQLDRARKSDYLHCATIVTAPPQGARSFVTSTTLNLKTYEYYTKCSLSSRLAARFLAHPKCVDKQATHALHHPTSNLFQSVYAWALVLGLWLFLGPPSITGICVCSR